MSVYDQLTAVPKQAITGINGYVGIKTWLALRGIYNHGWSRKYRHRKRTWPVMRSQPTHDYLLETAKSL